MFMMMTCTETTVGGLGFTKYMESCVSKIGETGTFECNIHSDGDAPEVTWSVVSLYTASNSTAHQRRSIVNDWNGGSSYRRPLGEQNTNFWCSFTSAQKLVWIGLVDVVLSLCLKVQVGLILNWQRNRFTRAPHRHRSRPMFILWSVRMHACCFTSTSAYITDVTSFAII